MIPFNYYKASKVLAHGKLHGKSSACNIYGTPSGTYDRWKWRLKRDKKLARLFEIDFKKMVEDWEQDITETIKKGLGTLNTALENHPFGAAPDTELGRKNWGYNVDFLGKAVKNVGELGLGAKVLAEEEDEEEEAS